MPNSKRIILAIAHQDFQPVEYGEAKKVLEAGGIKVMTASDGAGLATGCFGGEQIKIGLTLDEINPQEYAGLFFIGGPGALEHLDNEKSHKLIRDFFSAGKLLGAICIAPRILAHAGILKSKKVTGWDGDNDLGKILAAAEAKYVRESVVADGKLITATGPKVAAAWGQKILENLID